MKKLFNIIIFLGLILLPLVLNAAQDQVATIIFVQGKVEFKLKSKDLWQQAEVGGLVKIGDVLKTDKESSVEIAFDNKLNSIIKIDEYSTLTIKNFNPGQVSIAKGRVFALVDNLKKGSTFEIRTPQAVSGARGTAWSIATDTTKSNVETYERSIYVAGLDKNGNLIGQTDIPEGYRSSIGEFGLPDPPEELTDAQMANWGNLKSAIQEHKSLFLSSENDRDEENNVEQLEDRFQVMEEGREARFESMHESASERQERRQEAQESSPGDDNPQRW